MANRRMEQFNYTNLKAVCTLYFKVTFGASGAPTLATTNGGYISSIVRNSAGDYTITLADNYNALLDVNYVFNSGSSAPAAPAMWVKSDAIAASKTLRVVFNTGGTATDPASGEVLLMNIVCKNSSV